MLKGEFRSFNFGVDINLTRIAFLTKIINLNHISVYLSPVLQTLEATNLI